VIFVKEIPLTATGKIDKKELRAMYAKLWMSPGARSKL
jgi:acyl-CoA synthetase (AMP-forming)/AMP-acid ligase II